MENPEEILQCLEEFTKMKPRDIPRELEDYLKFVAKTGDPVYQWSAVKSLFREKLINVITEFYESATSVEIQTCRNVEIFNYDLMKNFILEKLDTFSSAPFTLQRISELLTNPRKEYTRIDKFMRALEKNILVVSTTEPGRRTENGDSIVNGIESDQYSIPEPINEINVEEMDYTSWSSPSLQTANHIAAAAAIAAATGRAPTSSSEQQQPTSFANSIVNDENDVEIDTPMETETCTTTTTTTTAATTTSSSEEITSEASTSSSSSSQEILCVQYVSIKELPSDDLNENDKETLTIRAVNIETVNNTVNSDFDAATTQIEETESLTTVIETSNNPEEINVSPENVNENQEIIVQSSDSNEAKTEPDSCETDNSGPPSPDNIPTTSSDHTPDIESDKLENVSTDVRITCSDLPSNENISSDNCSNQTNILFNETSSSSSSSTSTSSNESESNILDKPQAEETEINVNIEQNLTTTIDVENSPADDADSTTALSEPNSATDDVEVTTQTTENTEHEVESAECESICCESIPLAEPDSEPEPTPTEAETSIEAVAVSAVEIEQVEQPEPNLEADSSTLYENQIEKEDNDENVEKMDISEGELNIDNSKTESVADVLTNNDEEDTVPMEVVVDCAKQEPQSSSDLPI